MTVPNTLDFDALLDPAVRTDPYPLLHRIREMSPVAALDGALVVLGRHADCVTLFRDPRASSERMNSLLAPPVTTSLPTSFLFRDPPDHTRLRKLVAAAFTPRVVAGLKPHIDEIINELLGGAVSGAVSADGGGGIEVIGGLAYPLPVRVISELLGVPPEDRSLFQGWSARLARAVDPTILIGGQILTEVTTAREEFASYFRELIVRRRAYPADDLLSHLIRVEEDGDQLTEDELVVTCILLLVAGHETTVNLIGNGILALLRHPDQLAALRADPSRATAAVEETLRFDPPVQMTSRVARAGMRFGDVDAPDGATVLALLGAANRDPEVFTEPDRFDIGRAGAGANLAFAAGPHYCLGASLARLEAAAAFAAFATRVPDPRLDVDSLEYRPNLNLRGPSRVVVRIGA
jgi:cytochrome P450